MLEAFIKIAPLMPELLGKKKIAVWATDQEKYIYFKDYANFNTGMDVGIMLPKEDSAIIAMRDQKSIERIVPKEVFGRELRSFVVPVEGGTIGITFDFEDTRQVTEAIQILNSSQQEIYSASTDMAEHATSIAEWMNSIEHSAKEAIENKKDIEKVVVTIREIVDTLGLLSLNSMIEAARAGEHGKTFTVVANEVKKLAVEGKVKVEEINHVLANITNMLQFIYSEIEKVNEKIRILAESSIDIAKSNEQIATSVQSLDSMADNLR